MNRQQAEHILDAYVSMRMCESDKDASDALREMILDAMTSYTVNAGSIWRIPTYGNRNTVTCGGDA